MTAEVDFIDLFVMTCVTVFFWIKAGCKLFSKEKGCRGATYFVILYVSIATILTIVVISKFQRVAFTLQSAGEWENIASAMFAISILYPLWRLFEKDMALQGNMFLAIVWGVGFVVSLTSAVYFLLLSAGTTNLRL